MKDGYIKIESTDGEYYHVEAVLHNGNIWLTCFQIADLFGVYECTVIAKLKTLFKSGLLREDEVRRNTEVIRRNALANKTSEARIDLYNMEAIIMLSYHLTSSKAKMFRKWIQSNLVESIKRKDELPQIIDSMLFYNNRINH